MPLYGYECPKCGTSKDEWRTVAKRNDPCPCECGAMMAKQIGGYRVHPDLQPYYDDNLETHIKSKQHRQQVMREKGVSELVGKGWY